MRFFLAQLADFILTGVCKQIHIELTLADLQKAFDTADHGVL